VGVGVGVGVGVIGGLEALVCATSFTLIQASAVVI
jgi:hypothetical protein